MPGMIVNLRKKEGKDYEERKQVLLKNKPRNKWPLPYRNTTMPFAKNFIEILYNLFGETEAVLETETFKNFYMTLSRRERAEYYPEFDIIDDDIVCRKTPQISCPSCPSCKIIRYERPDRWILC